MIKKLRVLFGVFLLLAGCGFFLYPNIREWKTQQEVNQISAALRNDNFTADAKDETEESDIPFSDLHDEMQAYNEELVISGQNIMDAWNYEQAPSEFDLSLLDGAIGYIEIPDMKVRLPLYLGASGENLAKGAAVLSGTSMPIGGESTNCVIAGHRGWRGSAYFQYIENMEIGSLVYITNPWETLTYQVTGTDIVTPSNVDCTKIQEGKDMVTLISCHPYVLGGGAYRYLVFCERTEDVDDEAVLEKNVQESTEDINTVEAVEDREQDNLIDMNDNELLELEVRLRTVLPALTLLFAGVIILIRGRNRKKKNKKP